MRQLIQQHDTRGFRHRKFPSSIQHDAHEFLIHVISNLQEEENGKPRLNFDDKPGEQCWREYTKTHKSKVDQSLAGMIQSTVTCMGCKGKSFAHDPFLAIEID